MGEVLIYVCFERVGWRGIVSSGSSEIDFYPNTHAITVDFCLEASSKEGHTLFLTSFYFGYINVLQHTPLKLVLCLIELIRLLSIEVQYIFNSSQSVCKDGLENSCCILLWVVKRNWDLLYVYVTSIIVMPALRGHTECWVTQNAGPPSLGYISVNNLKRNKADQGRCLCFLGSLHSDKCRLKFIEKRLDLKII